MVRYEKDDCPACGRFIDFCACSPLCSSCKRAVRECACDDINGNNTPLKRDTDDSPPLPHVPIPNCS